MGIVVGLTEHSRLLARYRWEGRTTEELDRCALSSLAAHYPDQHLPLSAASSTTLPHTREQRRSGRCAIVPIQIPDLHPPLSAFTFFAATP